MAGGFNRKGRVLPEGLPAFGFVYDIFIAAFKADMMPAERLLNEIRKPRPGHGIGHHTAAGVFFERNGGRHGDQPVAVELFAVCGDRAAAVHIGVKNHAEVRVNA